MGGGLGGRLHAVRRRLTLRGGGVPPGVQELFDLGFDKNEYTRPNFYNEKGERIAPPKSAFAPGPEKENWAAEEMEAMAHRCVWGGMGVGLCVRVTHTHTHTHTHSMRPEDWPRGHPGYNGHPFSGVKRPGFFLEEFIHEESSDPHIQVSWFSLV